MQRRLEARRTHDPPMDVHFENPRFRIFVIQNAGGNRQHYYHFFFGILLPLTRYLAATGEADLPMILLSCGPFDRILHELALPRLMIAEKAAHRNLLESLPRNLFRRVGLMGLDLALASHVYDGAAIRAGTEWIRARWRRRLDEERRTLIEKWPETPRILLIDRGAPEAFYTSWLSEKPQRGVGAERRRVPNHAEVVAEVTRQHPGAKSALLEGMTLARQVALFDLADLVIAQHGAALANLVWMRPGGSVIEFDGGEPKHQQYFTKLSATIGLHHAYFHQDGPFGEIDPKTAASVATEMLDRTRRERAKQRAAMDDAVER